MINPSTATSGSPFTPTGASASIPVFSAIHQTHTPQSNLAKDDASTHKPSTASMMASIQSQHQKRPHPSQSLPYSVSAGASADSDAAHPASPKRQRYDSGHQQHHALSQLSPSSIDTISDFSNPQSAIATAALSASTGATAVATTGTMAISTGITKRPRRSSTTSSRTSTGSYLDVTANPRPTKAIKATVSSAPVAPSSGIDTINRPATHAPSRTGRGPTMAAQITDTLHHHAFHAHQSHAQMQQLSQHVDYTHTHVQAHNYARLPNLTGAGNITHPRRAAQNRAAQRTFRNRRKAYIKDMEEKVLELNQTRSRFGMIQNENREIWGRYRTLENLIVSNGLQMPSFTPMTPFFETEAGIAAAASYAALSASSGQSGTANTGGATESNRRASQGSEIDGEGEDESNLLSHQGMNYKQSSSERSEEDGDDQDDDGEHELDQDLGAYTIHPSSSSFQRQQQQQRMDARVQDMEIRRP
ncbi:hypothetical protein BGX27_010154 [Mortierella sp. AM989]|nr:hypothetical protein BGX27_010154 [Mortierella sp. AM989]